MLKKLPIGKSNFKKVIEDGDYFVDKSLFIKEVIDSSSETSLVMRPRRFGKTLNLSMLRYFFGNGNFIPTNKNLFKNLAIYKEDVFAEHFEKYQIIYLTFKDVKSDNFESSYNKIYSLIQKEFDKHHKKIDSLELSYLERKNYFDILEKKATQEELQESLILLSTLLFQAYNQKVVILIDEYDTPIHSAFVYDYYQKFVGFIRGFLSGGFKDNDYLYKGVITGILRVSKESIFSGLNNITPYTILDEKYGDKFGFTINETKKMLKDFDIEDRYAEVCDSYNGYNIGGVTIFNPWSILNYTDSKKLLPFWVNTASNDLIKYLFKNSSPIFKKNLQNFIEDKVVNVQLDTNVVFSELTQNDNQIYSLLFFSGYLKCVSRTLTDKIYRCNLMIPNKEVKYIYKKMIESWMNDAFRNTRLEPILKSLVDGEIEIFERLFSEFVLETLSFYDVNKKNEEAVYQAFILGLLVNLNDYEIISNQESGLGRFDIMILHKNNKQKLAIIMELKKIDDFKDETRKEALESAIKQIEDKKYEIVAKKRGYLNILKMGVVFDGKRVWVKE